MIAMNRKNIINIALIAAAVVLLGILASYVRIRPVADHVAVLRTFGMTCGSCAGKIEKALRSVSGVGGVEVDVEAGWVLVGYNAEVASPDSFAGVVTNTGFRSWLMEKMSTEQFRQIAGRDFGAKSRKSGGCGNGGCGSGGTQGGGQGR